MKEEGEARQGSREGQKRRATETSITPKWSSYSVLTCTYFLQAASGRISFLLHRWLYKSGGVCRRFLFVI